MKKDTLLAGHLSAILTTLCSTDSVVMMTDTRSPEGLVEGVGDNIIVNNVGSQLEGLIMTVTREELAIQHPPVIPRDDDDEDSDNNASADESDDGDHSSSDSLSYSRPSMSSGVPGLDMCENNTDCKSASEDVMDSQDEQLERPSLSRDQQPLVKHQDLSHPNGKDLGELYSTFCIKLHLFVFIPIIPREVVTLKLHLQYIT